jgi:hypothetical protein
MHGDALMSVAQTREMTPLIRPLRGLVGADPGVGSASRKAPGGNLLREVMADIGSAALVTTCLAPVGATLLTAVIHVHLDKALPVGSADPMPALFGNLLLSWLLLAVPCAFLRLGWARNVNRSAFEKIQNRLTEVHAWSDAPAVTQAMLCPDVEGAFCRTTAHGALKTHLRDARRGLSRPGIAWVLGTGYIGIWRRLNAAEALLAYVEPLDQVSTRALRLSARLAQSSLPGSAAMEARLGEARRALARRRAPTRTAHEIRKTSGKLMSEGDIRAVVCQFQFAIDDFRTDRYAGLVQARNLLLGASAIAGVALYVLLWLALGVVEAQVGWGLSFYLVGALVGILNVLYNQAGVDSSVEDYSLSTARVLVAPQLAGIAALIGVLVTAATAMTQGSASTALEAANQFARPVNFLAAAGFALSPGVVLSGLRKKTEDYKQELKSSRAIGRDVS